MMKRKLKDLYKKKFLKLNDQYIEIQSRTLVGKKGEILKKEE